MLVSENICPSGGGCGIIMLIKEIGLLCHIRVFDEMQYEDKMSHNLQFCDIINEQEIQLCIGLTQL